MSEILFCKGCNQNLPLRAFAKNANTITGRQTRCRECFKSYYDAKGTTRRKLTTQDVKQARQMIAAQMTLVSIAKKLNVGKHVIQKLNSGQTYIGVGV